MSRIVSEDEFILPEEDISLPSLETLLSMKEEALGRLESYSTRIADLKNWSTYFIVYVTATGYLLIDNARNLSSFCFLSAVIWPMLDIMLLTITILTFIASLYFFWRSIKMSAIELTPINQFYDSLETFNNCKIVGELAERYALQDYFFRLEKDCEALHNCLTQKYACHSRLIDFAVASTILALPAQIFRFLTAVP